MGDSDDRGGIDIVGGVVSGDGGDDGSATIDSRLTASATAEALALHHVLIV